MYGAGAEYALHSLLTLATRSEPVSVRDLATYQKIPERFLAKVFTRLKKAKLVVGTEGISCGFVLARPAENIRVLEVLGNEAGGALMLHRAITPGDLAVARPPDTLPAAEQRLPLAPDAFGRLLSWFDRMGLLTPVPGAPGQPGEALEWLISGCLGGSRLFNVHLPAAGGGAGGALIKAGRGSAGRAASAA